jgi:hypothetical protein
MGWGREARTVELLRGICASGWSRNYEHEKKVLMDGVSAGT